MSMMRSRRAQRWAFLVVGVAALAGALLGSYARIVLADSDEFANRVEAALEDPVVREELAKATVDLLVEQEPELITIQPLLVDIVDGVLATDAATSLLSAAVRDLHRTLFTDADDTIILEVSELLLVAKAQITALSPELGALIPDDLTDSIVEARARAASVDSAQFIAAIDQWVFLLLAIAAVAFVGVLWRSPDASTGLANIGVGLIATAVVSLVAITLGELLLVGGESDVHRAVWNAFADPFDDWILMVAGAGAIVAVIAWFGVGELANSDRVSEIVQLARRRTRPVERLVWGASFVVIGLLVLFNRDTVVQLAVVLIGVFALTAGIREIVAVVAPSLVEGVADRRRDEPSHEGGEGLDCGSPEGRAQSRRRWASASSRCSRSSASPGAPAGPTTMVRPARPATAGTISATGRSTRW